MEGLHFAQLSPLHLAFGFHVYWTLQDLVGAGRCLNGQRNPLAGRKSRDSNRNNVAHEVPHFTRFPLKAQVGPFIHNITGREGLPKRRLRSASDLMRTRWTDLWARNTQRCFPQGGKALA